MLHSDILFDDTSGTTCSLRAVIELSEVSDVCRAAYEVVARELGVSVPLARDLWELMIQGKDDVEIPPHLNPNIRTQDRNALDYPPAYCDPQPSSS